jgi:hypothetical protein
MKPSVVSIVAVAGLAGGFALAGRAGSSNPAPRSVVLSSAAKPMQHAVPSDNANPDACNTKQPTTVNPAGGGFRIPACAGFTGRITYGPNNAVRGYTVTLVSAATSNPDPSNCGPPTPGEMVVFFVTAVGSSAVQPSVTYGMAANKSAISNPGFGNGNTFTLLAYKAGVLQFSEKLGSPRKGVLRFASPLNGQTVPTNVVLCYELALP